MKLSIIIVSFNTRELLLNCLNSIYVNYNSQLESHEFEIIVVDNKSTDDTVEKLRKSYSGVILIENQENTGFAKANNQGIKLAKGELILLLNPDTVVPSETLTKMVKFMGNSPDVGIATCKVLLTDGSLDDACHRGFPTPIRALFYFLGFSRLFPQSVFFNGYHLGYQHMTEIHEIDSCVGAFLLIKKSIFEKVGGLDEDYFWYGEDLDLCFRVKQSGYKIMYVPEVFITHHKGAASGLKQHSKHLSKADLNTRKRATRARFEVMKIFYRKHFFDKYPRWLTALVLTGINMKQQLTEFML